MPNNLRHLREEWGAKLDKLRSLVPADNTRQMSPDELAAYTALERETDELEARIERMQRAQDRESRAKSLTDVTREQAPEARQKREAFLSFVRTGDEAMRRGLIASDDTKGGVFATAELLPGIEKTELELTPLRSLATVRTTSNRSVKFNRRNGTFAAAWTGETSARTETDGLRYIQDEIPTHELYARVVISQQDLEDASVDLEAIINEEAGEQFAVAESTAFLTGNGVQKPLGITIDTAVSDTNSGSNGDFDGDDLIDILYSLKATYGANATWLLNRTTLRKIRKLKANNEYIWTPMSQHSGSLAGGMAPVILDRPYVIAPEMSSTGTTGNISVVCADVRRGYMIVDRVGISVLRDPYTDGANGNVILHMRKRVGGQVIRAEAIARLKESA